MLSVPIVDHPVGPDGLRGYSTAAVEGASPDRPRARDDAEGVAVRGVFVPPVDRHLYIVGGKGGVGKSTAAASIAIALAARGLCVRLIGLDPAGSLGDLLGVSGDRLPDPIHGSGSLQVTELDAQTVWSNFVDGYRERIEELFGRILSGGVSGTADREVVQRLMDLAPPGLDELVALLELVDASGDRIYDALVLDTAPTGHLLRLLEMPDVALDWCHTLMRLLLKYREVVPMGDVGEEVLDLTKRIRAFSRRLVDRDFTWFLAVALPEPLSLPETERLLARVRRTGIEPGALLINRAMDGDAIDPAAAHWARRLIALDPTLPAVGAPALSSGPTGTSGLRHYVEGWRIIEMR